MHWNRRDMTVNVADEDNDNECVYRDVPMSLVPFNMRQLQVCLATCNIALLVHVKQRRALMVAPDLQLGDDDDDEEGLNDDPASDEENDDQNDDDDDVDDDAVDENDVEDDNDDVDESEDIGGVDDEVSVQFALNFASTFVFCRCVR
jgi:hypothetical protein